jgi:anti-sigma regulatory factor (Ser/Thr protein kinase)
MDASNTKRDPCLLRPSVGAPAIAREYVASKLRTWGIDDAFPDVELLTSELVTNAIRHSEGTVELSIDHPSADCVRIEVRDLSERLPVMRPLETARDGGWGLHIVGSIATRWGLEQRTGEKTIWCEVAPAGYAEAVRSSAQTVLPSTSSSEPHARDNAATSRTPRPPAAE